VTKFQHHALLAAALSVLILTGACDRKDRGQGAPARGPNERAEPVRVLATVYPLAAIVRQVGGERVTLEWFRESGQSPAALDASADNREMLRRADLVVISGTEPPWITSALDDPYQAQRLIRLDRLPSSGLLSSAATSPDEPQAPGQPYEWLLPEIARELAERLSQRLSVLEPDHASLFAGNAQALSAELNEILKQAPPSGDAPFATTDPGFNALAALLGRLPVLHGPAMPLPLNATDLTRVQNVLRSRSMTTLYIPADTPPAVVRDLASHLGDDVSIKTLDAFGSSAPRGRNTYAALLRYNLQQLSAKAPASAPVASPTTQ
jgi:ABC-type Zn uptake system ZnuABC Zn-binding protein ZnuA